MNTNSVCGVGEIDKAPSSGQLMIDDRPHISPGLLLLFGISTTGLHGLLFAALP